MDDIDYRKSMDIKIDDLLPDITELMKHGFNVLAYGPPGTGKTSLAHKLMKQLKKEEPLTFQCHEEASQAELVVQYLPSPEGGVVVMEGVAVRGWASGRMLVLDEINHLVTSPAMSTVYRIMDDPTVAQFVMPNGDIIRPQPGFCVWGTMNGDPEELPEAIRDRFHLTVCMWRPTQEMVDSLPPSLRKVPNQAYADPNNAFPTFREIRNFGECCKALGVDPSETADEKVKNVARMIWGPRWAEALHVVDSTHPGRKKE